MHYQELYCCCYRQGVHLLATPALMWLFQCLPTCSDGAAHHSLQAQAQPEGVVAHEH